MREGTKHPPPAPKRPLALKPIFAERLSTTLGGAPRVSGGLVKLTVKIQLAKARKLALKYIFVVFERDLTHRNLAWQLFVEEDDGSGLYVVGRHNLCMSSWSLDEPSSLKANRTMLRKTISI
ncbi:MAG: hypothetical protein E5X63_03785 [Mesorhizobium sp.]|nr:MAG: hypothetical protein E5X63_03785 [Mesorhizobium sp.]